MDCSRSVDEIDESTAWEDSQQGTDEEVVHTLDPAEISMKMKNIILGNWLRVQRYTSIKESWFRRLLTTVL